jgi:hypothetical protein
MLMALVAPADPANRLELYFGGGGTGVTLPGDAAGGVFQWSLPLSSGLAAGRLTLELQGSNGGATGPLWPYLNVE